VREVAAKYVWCYRSRSAPDRELVVQFRCSGAADGDRREVSVDVNWTILEVAIGLSFLFFLLSVVTSAVNEAVAGVLKLRAKTLEKGVLNMITGSTSPQEGDVEIANKIFGHALIRGFGKDGSKPSYLPSRSFRNALFDVIGLLETTSDPPEDAAAYEKVQQQVETAIGELPNPHLQATLTSIWHSVNHDVGEFRRGVDRWFDTGMERVTGWYKRRTQVILFGLGLATAVVVNANTLTAADRLWKADGVREGLVAQVEVQQNEVEGVDALDELESLQFPVGWERSNRPDGVDGWAVAIAGWLLTGFAITLGAPFWFDLLGRFSNLRAAGGRPDSSVPPAPSETDVSAVRLTVATDTSTTATPP
jgi:hypothetical protein